jgi:hypothetical protein
MHLFRLYSLSVLPADACNPSCEQRHVMRNRINKYQVLYVRSLYFVHKQRGADVVRERVHTETSVVSWHLCPVVFW